MIILILCLCYIIPLIVCGICYRINKSLGYSNYDIEDIKASFVPFANIVTMIAWIFSTIHQIFTDPNLKFKSIIDFVVRIVFGKIND